VHQKDLQNEQDREETEETIHAFRTPLKTCEKMQISALACVGVVVPVESEQKSAFVEKAAFSPRFLGPSVHLIILRIMADRFHDALDIKRAHRTAIGIAIAPFLFTLSCLLLNL
jgi:hypothetical protein